MRFDGNLPSDSVTFHTVFLLRLQVGTFWSINGNKFNVSTIATELEGKGTLSNDVCTKHYERYTHLTTDGLWIEN